MARHIWSVLCEQVLVDEKTGATSHINCFDGVVLSEFPLLLPDDRLVLATMWAKEHADDPLHVRVRLVAPDGDGIYVRVTEPRRFGAQSRYGLNVRLGNVQLDAPGEFVLTTEHRETAGWITDHEMPMRFERVSP